ncbi:MAG: LLM class flavin-dependent oxidoreductase [Dehalococcoidia bacterium]
MRRSLVLIVDPLSELADLGRRAEAAGFEAVWLTDFFNRDVFVRMAAVGMATSTIGVGSGIGYAFARSPVLTAAAAADLDELTGGRVILGLGTGTRRMQEKWYGLEFESPAPKTAEVIRLLRELWAAPGGRPFKFDGRFYKLAIDFFGRPGRVRSNIPVYLAGVNKIMIRTAAEVADGLVGHPLFSRRYITEVVTPAVAEGLRRGGRERSAFDLAGFVSVAISADGNQAREEARRQIGFYATALTYEAILNLHGWTKERETIRAAFERFDFPAMTAAVTDEMVEQMAVAGTPDECRQQLKKWGGLLDHAMLCPPSFGVRPERLSECYRLIIDTFGRDS